LLVAAIVLAAVACGYDTSATFNVDGTVTVGLKFLLPKSLLEGGPNVTVHGFSQADIDKANAELATKYPGAKITKVTEGDESGVALTVPFKTEKDAFAFLTQPSKLSPGDVSSGSSSSIDVGNTGGLFVSATHTTSGQADTYTFKTQAQPPASPSPGSQITITPDELGSILSVTFSLTVPHEITSAPGALFTIDRRTAIWKLSLTEAQTLTATTGPAIALAGSVSSRAVVQNPVLLTGIGLAIAVAFLLGMFTSARLFRRPALGPAAMVADGASTTGQPQSVSPPTGWPGPPSDAAPPNA